MQKHNEPTPKKLPPWSLLDNWRHLRQAHVDEAYYLACVSHHQGAGHQFLRVLALTDMGEIDTARIVSIVNSWPQPMRDELVRRTECGAEP